MISNISVDQFQKSKFFIYKNGRLLERKLFEYFFEDGAKLACLRALSAYQNEDGGFGNGIEPDLLCPDSSAIGAETALYVLELLDCQNSEIAHRLADWIILQTNAEGFIPHPPENLFHYPYQPWWKNPDKERILSLAGILKKWGLDQPAFIEKVRNCYITLPFPVEFEFYHYPFFVYLQSCRENEQDNAKFTAFVNRIPDFLRKYSSYFPLFSRYWSFARDYVDKDILEREAGIFVNALQEDGGILTPYPDLPWWQPIFLLDGLIQMKKTISGVPGSLPGNWQKTGLAVVGESNVDILGIPYIVWGFGGLAMAALWVFIWPHKENVRENSLQYFILRWSHSLVWLFLAAAGFISNFNILGGRNTAQLMALLALITYMVFMTTVVTTK